MAADRDGTRSRDSTRDGRCPDPCGTTGSRIAAKGASS
eukprot:CAMPEP_0170090866 /NCGR_PEP_ID=MMETSP0019_2-20121128/24619_1 /TAXON_ID=98059 /ORGANISM="Dinobryon sp., Strain UTEXLB2267" /LENGTH=37 /DNA_ID= /DNA_START= /DNA_END= /DNA_ORIENTATION=